MLLETVITIDTAITTATTVNHHYFCSEYQPSCSGIIVPFSMRPRGQPGVYFPVNRRLLEAPAKPGSTSSQHCSDVPGASRF